MGEPQLARIHVVDLHAYALLVTAATTQAAIKIVSDIAKALAELRSQRACMPRSAQCRQRSHIAFMP